MTQEDKQLLLVDLCARLHYRVKIKWCDGLHDDYYTLIGINEQCIIGKSIDGLEPLFVIGEEDVKPYLRPMSSMTEEEWNDLVMEQTCGDRERNMVARFDWLNKNMFDYRGLIPKGLAIEVTEENNPYKD